MRHNYSSFRSERPALDAEDLPTTDPSTPSSGVLVDDDFRTHVSGYWRYYCKPYHVDYRPTYAYGTYNFPDLAWRWPATKHPYILDDRRLGLAATDHEPGLDYWSYEYDIDDIGVWIRGIPQFSFRTYAFTFTPSGFPPFNAFTAYLKFAWGGGYAGGVSGLAWETPPMPPSSAGLYSQGLAGTWNANANAGVYNIGIQPDSFAGGSSQHTGQLYVSLFYGYYDPGPGDTVKLAMTFYYPLASVLSPNDFYYNKQLVSGNGDAGKYTLVITSDGAQTAYGMIHGWNGGEPEWFGIINPFVYDTGPGNNNSIIPAITYYPPPIALGQLDFGGFLGSSYASFNGWLHEYALSTYPYDTVLLGNLGSLIPVSPYLHLDQVRYRAYGPGEDVLP